MFYSETEYGKHPFHTEYSNWSYMSEFNNWETVQKGKKFSDKKMYGRDKQDFSRWKRMPNLGWNMSYSWLKYVKVLLSMKQLKYVYIYM